MKQVHQPLPQVAAPGRCRRPAPVVAVQSPPTHPWSLLQHLAGNEAVRRLASGRLLQPKLTINQPGDAHEQEADRVADAVMRMPDPTTVETTPIPPTSPATGLQRCACGGSSGKGEPCMACKEEEESQLHRSAAAPAATGVAPPIVHDVLRSAGEPLDAATRGFMELRFGRDLSTVRIHTDPQAAESTRAVHAHAYAVGRDVVFGAGRYRPGTGAGRRLLAHELAHVVSQGGASGVLHRYDESTEPNTAFGQGVLDVASILGPAIRGVHAFFCLRPLEQPMKDITFDRWIPAVCARGAQPLLRNRTWDSFGHCWIGCEASRKCGRGAAAVVGTGREFTREIQRVLGIRPHDSFKQDLANQRKGRALSFTAGTCYTLCDEAYRTGGLDLSAPEGTCIDCASGSEGPCPP